MDVDIDIDEEGARTTMAEWFLSYGGKQEGPYTTEQAAERVAKDPSGFAWRQGYAEWLPMSAVDELRSAFAAPPPPPSLARHKADEVDFRVFGTEMQYVEIELDPGESVVAEAGGMMYKDPRISMESIFGDGSASSSGGGFMGKLMGAGKRVLSGESLFMTLFTHTGQGKAKVAFAAPYPGNILPLHLDDLGGTLICQKDSFLCAAKGVAVGIYLQKKILTGLFGGEGFIMQRLDGDGMVFVHAGGTLMERELAPGEALDVDTGCVVAFAPSVQFDVRQAGNIKTALFGGEGLFFAHLQGPGKVWLQSLPFSRLASRMLLGSGGKDEGSVLPNIGGLFRGDGN